MEGPRAVFKHVPLTGLHRRFEVTRARRWQLDWGTRTPVRRYTAGLFRATRADFPAGGPDPGRTTVVRERPRAIQRLEKLLADTGVKLSSVAFDITGVFGRAMLEALIAGQRGPAALAALAKRRLQVSAYDLTSLARYDLTS